MDDWEVEGENYYLHEGDTMSYPNADLFGYIEDDVCGICYPLGCDDPDGHLGVPQGYEPNRDRGCRCGSDSHGGDCMCFEFDYED